MTACLIPPPRNLFVHSQFTSVGLWTYRAENQEKQQKEAGKKKSGRNLNGGTLNPAETVF